MKRGVAAGHLHVKAALGFFLDEREQEKRDINQRRKRENQAVKLEIRLVIFGRNPAKQSNHSHGNRNRDSRNVHYPVEHIFQPQPENHIADKLRKACFFARFCGF